MLSSLKEMFGHGHRNQEGLSGDHESISVDPLTQRPTIAWQKMQVKQTFSKADQLDPDTPISEDKVRFVCISDTHAQIEKLMTDFVPHGDVLLHAGDFTNIGQPHEVQKLNEFLGKLPHKHKIVIAGNHDLTFDDDLMKEEPETNYLKNYFNLNVEKVKEFLENAGVRHVKELLTNCTYLEDDLVELYGITIYGSPWQPVFGGWGFNLPRGEKCLEKWNLIPDDTDILMTHGPPIGHGDLCFDQQRAGCIELLNTIQKRVKPKYHVFGHIHEAYGATTDGVTTYINASSCTLQYKCKNRPIVFDFPIPEGHSKEEAIGQIISCGRTMEDKMTAREDNDSDSVVFEEEKSESKE